MAFAAKPRLPSLLRPNGRPSLSDRSGTTRQRSRTMIEVTRLDIQSIAVPPLGCGLGGLAWSEVRPRIEQAFAVLPDVKVLLFEPDGVPVPREMVRSTNAPAMTPGRAVLVGAHRALPRRADG